MLRIDFFFVVCFKVGVELGLRSGFVLGLGAGFYILPIKSLHKGRTTRLRVWHLTEVGPLVIAPS